MTASFDPRCVYPHERISARALWETLADCGVTFSGVVLDVGAGRSAYRRLLGPDATWVAVDLAAADADVRADAAALPFRRGSADGVLCTQVLEHLEEPAGALAEIARVVRPGGIIVLSAPQTFQLHEEPRDFWRFTSHGLRLLVSRAGLELISLRPTTDAALTAAQVLISSIARFGGTPRRFNLIERGFRWYGQRHRDWSHPLDYVVVARR